MLHIKSNLKDKANVSFVYLARQRQLKLQLNEYAVGGHCGITHQ